MAKIVQETLTITVSKLLREDCASAPILPEHFMSSLEEVAAELIGDASVIVEVKPEFPDDHVAGD